MTARIAPAYDLTTLLRARGNSPLYGALGIATTLDWVARTPPLAPFALDAYGQATGFFDPTLFRSSCETLAAFDRYGGLDPQPRDGALFVKDRAEGYAYCENAGRTFGVTLRQPQFDALVESGDHLLAAYRPDTRVWAVVVRDGAVIAAIRGQLTMRLREAVVMGLLPVVGAELWA